MDQLFPQSLQHSGSYIQVTITVIMSCLRGFGLRFDEWLFPREPQHWWSCECRSVYKDKCINSDYSLSICFFGLVVRSVVCMGATALVELRV